ncbi:MAG TPA: AMP-binding protein [Acidimicrobiia bacterium]|nr:AMP-binding protein [Acidimicrobiia bacterium]
MRPVDQLSEAVRATRALVRSGVLRPERPDRLWRIANAARHWGPGLAAVFAIGAARYGDRAALVDEQGALSFSELDGRASAVARGLIETGVHAGDTVAVLCRNHRYFFEISGALTKLGANALYVNTGLAGPQIAAVLDRERAILVVHDEEFSAVVAEAGNQPRLLAWTDPSVPTKETRTLDELAARHADGPPLARPARDGRTIIMTSGTTGPPKGAFVANAPHVGAGIALLERLPYRAQETMVIAAPCFHAWGFANASTSLLLGDTMVFERHFDPERSLALIERHRAQVFVAIPVMLMRLMELPEETRRRYDTTSLRFVPLSGSALPGDLAPRFMDAFGDVVYNLYGSTEVGSVSVATPADLRDAPATAGRPPRGTLVRLLDDDGHEVPPGTNGRIFVRGPLTFSGYTDGGSKAMIDGFMHTGDTGHFDAAGRLFVDGRDDEMVVSGGENVFPPVVEDVIARHPDVVEAAVVGVPDPEFGARLKAFVVARPGATVDTESIREYVRANLARFKVPREVEFVDELPRNGTGKVLRRDLEHR